MHNPSTKENYYIASFWIGDFDIDNDNVLMGLAIVRLMMNTSGSFKEESTLREKKFKFIALKMVMHKSFRINESFYRYYSCGADFANNNLY